MWTSQWHMGLGMEMFLVLQYDMFSSCILVMFEWDEFVVSNGNYFMCSCCMCLCCVLFPVSPIVSCHLKVKYT